MKPSSGGAYFCAKRRRNAGDARLRGGGLWRSLASGALASCILSRQAASALRLGAEDGHSVASSLASLSEATRTDDLLRGSFAADAAVISNATNLQAANATDLQKQPFGDFNSIAFESPAFGDAASLDGDLAFDDLYGSSLFDSSSYGSSLDSDLDLDNVDDLTLEEEIEGNSLLQESSPLAGKNSLLQSLDLSTSPSSGTKGSSSSGTSIGKQAEPFGLHAPSLMQASEGQEMTSGDMQGRAGGLVVGQNAGGGNQVSASAKDASKSNEAAATGDATTTAAAPTATTGKSAAPDASGGKSTSVSPDAKAEMKEEMRMEEEAEQQEKEMEKAQSEIIDNLAIVTQSVAGEGSPEAATKESAIPESEIVKELESTKDLNEKKKAAQQQETKVKEKVKKLEEKEKKAMEHFDETQKQQAEASKKHAEAAAEWHKLRSEMMQAREEDTLITDILARKEDGASAKIEIKDALLQQAAAKLLPAHSSMEAHALALQAAAAPQSGDADYQVKLAAWEALGRSLGKLP
eukprot:TRINITY_DN90364_c0_g1_i1.p1 TRINITY_DN90364_c0_g1~~TRINITY_DN90364_c0_g1_i1.p1  ORF type:complete len:521 (-),score=181.69 TRINITY_DN90364_c0_g1_i1:26-1588(-)